MRLPIRSSTEAVARRRVRPSATLLATCLCSPAWAAEGTPAGSFLRELAAILLPLAFVIVLLVVVLLVLRRRMLPNGTAQGALRVEQVLPVGPRDRLVLVSTPGGRRLLVGVGAGGPRLVAELSAEDMGPSASRRDGA